jgi:hypothetical protein
VSFLSSEQRKKGIRQNREYDAALAEDEKNLNAKLAEVSELRRCVKYRIDTIASVDEGTASAEMIQLADNAVRECLFNGMVHYPVVIIAGERKVVRA